MKAALLISVSEYKNPTDNLPGCEQDLAIMHKLLELTGEYKEILALSGSNTTAIELKSKIAEWIEQRRSETLEEIFFYYSGHGKFKDNEFYFQLYDYQAAQPRQTGLANSELDGWLRGLSPNLTVKVIDACNSGVPYIKGGQDYIEKYFTDSGKGFQKCIFMYSSTVTQSSYQNNQISAFTRAFVDAVGQHKGEVIRYRDISNSISDQFESNGWSEMQAPVFVTQAHNTEVFCHINDQIRQLAAQEQFTKQVDALNASQSTGLKQIVAEAEKLIPSKEQALKTLLELKSRLETFSYSSELTEIYSIEPKLIPTSQVPLGIRIGQELASTGHNYFAKPTHTTVFDNPLDAVMAQQSTIFNYDRGLMRSRGRKEVSGFEFTAEVPFQAFQVVAERKYLSLPHYYCVVTYLVSMSKIRFYSYYTLYRDKNWDDASLDLNLLWQNTECSLTDAETVWNTGIGILSGFEIYVLEHVKTIFGQK